MVTVCRRARDAERRATRRLRQADLRGWGGGRESSSLYHWAKRAALPQLVLTWVIYLALPFSLHPSFVVLLFVLSVTVTASTFGKYL